MENRFLHFTNAPTEGVQKALPEDIDPPILEWRLSYGIPYAVLLATPAGMQYCLYCMY